MTTCPRAASEGNEWFIRSDDRSISDTGDIFSQEECDWWRHDMSKTRPFSWEDGDGLDTVHCPEGSDAAAFYLKWDEWGRDTEVGEGIAL